MQVPPKAYMAGKRITADMKYREAINFIDSSFVSFQTAGKEAYKEGLENIRLMMKHLGNPHRDYPVIHVAGTNGKGSVSHILASVLQSAGYRTGLFTSPHLHEFRERMRIDGVLIAEKEVAAFITENAATMKELELSYIDMTSAMAFDWFSKANVEVAVIETGLGGRLDATNIVLPELSVITNIGLDHTDVLGNTLPAVAAEKGGIIKREIPLVIGERNAETDPVFIRLAEENCAEIIFAEDAYRITASQAFENYVRYTIERVRDGRIESLDLDLHGSYQAKNIITARAAVHAMRHLTNLSISSRALREGCRLVKQSTGLTGRWQIIGKEPLTVCDTGHNAHGLKYVTEQLKEYNYGKRYIVMGVSGDKQLSSILPLFPPDAYYIFTQADSPRACPAAELARQANNFGLAGEVVPIVKDALAKARSLASPEDMIFVGGSSFVVAEII